MFDMFYILLIVALIIAPMGCVALYERIQGD